MSEKKAAKTRNVTLRVTGEEYAQIEKGATERARERSGGRRMSCFMGKFARLFPAGAWI